MAKYRAFITLEVEITAQDETAAAYKIAMLDQRIWINQQGIYDESAELMQTEFGVIVPVTDD